MAEPLDRRFFIISQYNPELVLDVEQKNTAPGAKIILWEQKKDSDARNQLFYIDEKLDRIRSALNGFCLDIKVSGKSKTFFTNFTDLINFNLINFTMQLLSLV